MGPETAARRLGMKGEVKVRRTGHLGARPLDPQGFPGLQKKEPARSQWCLTNRPDRGSCPPPQWISSFLLITSVPPGPNPQHATYSRANFRWVGLGGPDENFPNKDRRAFSIVAYAVRD